MLALCLSQFTPVDRPDENHRALACSMDKRADSHLNPREARLFTDDLYISPLQISNLPSLLAAGL